MREESALTEIQSIASLGCHSVLEYNGVNVCWREFGSGNPLVLIHGGHGNWLHWVHNIIPLSKYFRVLVPDLPGFGESGDVKDFQELLQATCTTLKQLLGESTDLTVVGFSFGGLVAAHLSNQLKIHRLVLLGPAGHGGERRPKGQLIDWHRAYKRKDQDAVQAAMRHNLMMHMLHHQESLTPLAVQLHTEACIQTRFRSKAISQQGGILEILSQRKLRTECIWGEHDVTATPSACSELLRACNEKISVRILPEAGHWVQFEQFDIVNKLILSTEINLS